MNSLNLQPFVFKFEVGDRVKWNWDEQPDLDGEGVVIGLLTPMNERPGIRPQPYCVNFDGIGHTLWVGDYQIKKM